MYYVRLFYDVAYYDHIEYQKLSDYTHTARQEFGYTFNRFTINVKNSITPRQVVSVGERTDLGPAGSTISPITDLASMDINYKISPKTTASFLYYYDLFYEPHFEGDSSNSQTHTFGPRIQYQVTPKNQVYGSLLWRNIDYFDDQETKSWTMTPSVGIKSRISPKMTLNFEAAFPSREYKDDLISVVDGVALRGALFRRISPKVSGSIFGTWDNSVEDLDTSRSQNPTRMTQTYGATLSWDIAPRLSFNADASATFNESEGFDTVEDPENDTLSFTRQPEDQSYQWGVGLNWYPKRYVSLFLGYQFLNHNDSFKNNEYDRHKGVGSINARF